MSSAAPAKDTGGIQESGLQALKWLALALMVVDHVNAIVLHFGVPTMFRLGRLAFPIFAFVFAYNLARPSMNDAALRRVMKRLVLYGMLAIPAYVYAHGWWPCNVLWTFALAAYLVLALRQRARWHVTAAIVAFLVGGTVVEFWWFGLAYCISCWWYCRTRSWISVSAVIITCASLAIVNTNYWALAALPLITVIAHLRMKVPRFNRVFYWFYPAHLTVLALISWGLSVSAH